MELKYSQGMASEQDIYFHLITCNENFIPHLEKRVNIREYSTKIFEKAVTFEAWFDNTLVGLVAIYLNDPEGQSGYITNVSSIRRFMAKGIASHLINMSIDYARQHNFKTIFLEVAKENVYALKMYKKHQFQEFKVKQDTILMKYD